MPPIVSAQVFIDWDTARRVVRPRWPTDGSYEPTIKERAANAVDCFSEIQRRLAPIVAGLVGSPVTILKSRLYHGWHRGQTATPDRRALEVAKLEFLPHVLKKKISYLPDVEFGNDLVCRGDRVPLMDTLRSRGDGPDAQKMVDTALVADLLGYCRTESKNFRRGEKPASMALVIADDDDLMPGIFTAEAWGLPSAVFRVNREHESRHLRLANLVHTL